MSAILAESNQLASISQIMTLLSFNIQVVYQTTKFNDKKTVFILKIINLETSDILSKGVLLEVF